MAVPPICRTLSPHGSMTLERIQTPLRLLASGESDRDVKFPRNMLQLQRFLQTLVVADILVNENNTYSLPKQEAH